MQWHYGLLSLFLLLLVPNAFAANPGQGGEFDFDFENFSVSQNESSPDKLVITADIISAGTAARSSVDIYAIVTAPDGHVRTHFTDSYNLAPDESRSIKFTQSIYLEGDYSVELSMKPTSSAHQHHIFDSVKTGYSIGSYGLEQRLVAIGTDTDESVGYDIATKVSISKTIHAVVSLPDADEFEKIVVTNGDFRKEFSIDSTDIYLRSTVDYSNLHMELVRPDNLLPAAGAQEPFQHYVTFYAVGSSVCAEVSCNKIDVFKPVVGESVQEPEEFPYLILGVVAIVVIVSVAIIWNKYYRSSLKIEYVEKRYR